MWSLCRKSGEKINEATCQPALSRSEMKLSPQIKLLAAPMHSMSVAKFA
jgi:hypothetical protein